MVSKWRGCFSPTTGVAKDATWAYCLPGLSWTVHMSLRCVFLKLPLHIIFAHTQVFVLNTICKFSKQFPDIWGESIQGYLFIFLVWRAGRKRCLMKFSETGVMKVLDFVSSEKLTWCDCLLFTAEWKHKGPSMYLGQFSSIKTGGIRKSLKFIHWKRTGKNNAKRLPQSCFHRSRKLM